MEQAGLNLILPMTMKQALTCGQELATTPPPLVVLGSDRESRGPRSKCNRRRRCHSVTVGFLWQIVVIFWSSQNSSSSSSSRSRIHCMALIVSNQRQRQLTKHLELKQQQLPPLERTKSRMATRKTIQPSLKTRRKAFTVAAGLLTSGFLLSNYDAEAAATKPSNDCGLEDIRIGRGQWTNAATHRDPSSSSSSQLQHDRTTRTTSHIIIPATFSTYASRFLLHYDDGVASWWQGCVQSCSLLASHDEQEAKLRTSFGHLARSIHNAVAASLQDAPTIQQGYENLLLLFLNNYGNNDDEARRHIGLLFAMLPQEYQPTKLMSRIFSKTLSTARDHTPLTVVNPPIHNLMGDFTALLPAEFECVRVKETGEYTIYPSISLYEITVDEGFGQTVTNTAAGPLAALPLQREIPNFTAIMYALFGISGAAGCALTHTIVIPLDVVKTRVQTNPSLGRNNRSMIDSAAQIVQEEGMPGLLLGAQATIAGYVWYGLSVYPSYTFFKRWIGQSLLSPELVMVHNNDIALVAGALAAVIASLGLTPMEAARIRTVAEPDVYRAKGLIGTLQIIATEDPSLGWKTLFAGLPSLLVRQVIFGSIKFLAFERACEAIFHQWPFLQDETWTSLLVSLVAGGFSGCLSSVVSQPADSVLTYVAQNSNVGLLQGSRIMVDQEGFGSLFRGLGSRCVWAGSIIAGQFLLYDVFRTYFGVNSNDLSQAFEVVISGSYSA